MITTDPPLWDSYTGENAKAAAGMFARAAELIDERGHEAYPEYEGSGPGLDIRGALEAAVAEFITAAYHLTGPHWAGDLADELETRLAGVMYVAGICRRRTGVQDVNDAVVGWERSHYEWPGQPSRRPGKNDVVRLLKLAAACAAAADA